MSYSPDQFRFPTSDGVVYVADRAGLARVEAWQTAFARQCKDRRYYEIVEDSLDQGFEHQYFVIEDAGGRVRAIQPFFLLRQDLLQGSSPRVRKWADVCRRALPRFLTLRTLMVGCAAGEGHLDIAPEDAAWVGERLHEALRAYAKQVRTPMIVLKEFSSRYREALRPFSGNGYVRVPSLPGVRLHLPYASFEDYMAKALSKATRKDLRRKFRDAEQAGITMEVLHDISGIIDEVYPLYLQVFERSNLHFEKLTPAYFCRISREMPDKARFFVWRQNGRAIAFSFCLAQGDELYDEYLGLDYAVALDLHLYFYTLRDVLDWCMRNGIKWYCSSGLGYEPKLRLKAVLAPVDLYVSHTFGPMNFILKRVLPLLEPTRNEPTLPEYPNYEEIWGKA